MAAVDSRLWSVAVAAKSVEAGSTGEGGLSKGLLETISDGLAAFLRKGTCGTPWATLEEWLGQGSKCAPPRKLVASAAPTF